jgi:F-type H+-transporting ATPase subunit b
MADNAHTTAEVQHEGGHAFPPFDSSTFGSQILWLAITFGVLYVLMAKVVLPRIGGILEDRHARIAGDLAEAERLKADSEAAGVAYEAALAEARRNAQAIAAANREKLAREVDGRRQAAEQKLAGDVAVAEARIAEIKAKALGEVDAIAIETTEAVVTALIGETASRDEVAEAVAAVGK